MKEHPETNTHKRNPANIRDMNAQASQITPAAVADMTALVDRVSGLVAFGLATGAVSNPVQWNFLSTLCGSFKGAKDAQTKASHFSEIADTLCAVSGLRESKPGKFMADYLAQPEGPARTAFYARHRDNLLDGLKKATGLNPARFVPEIDASSAQDFGPGATSLSAQFEELQRSNPAAAKVFYDKHRDAILAEGVR